MTGLAVYIVTDAVIAALRLYYHSETLTVAGINAGLPEGLVYHGDIRDALPTAYEKRSRTNPTLLTAPGLDHPCR